MHRLLLLGWIPYDYPKQSGFFNKKIHTGIPINNPNMEQNNIKIKNGSVNLQSKHISH